MATIHFGAPGGELECAAPNTGDNITENFDAVTCETCRTKIAPYIDGAASSDDCPQARKLFPSVFEMLGE